jgi:hypothetical protein
MMAPAPGTGKQDTLAANGDPGRPFGIQRAGVVRSMHRP